MKQLLMLLMVILVMGLMYSAPNSKSHDQGVPCSRGMLPVLEAAAKDGTIPAVVSYKTLPLYFIPNQGQVDAKAGFYARTPRYTLWLTKDALIFDSIGGSSDQTRSVTRLTFPGANKNPTLIAQQPTKHRVNYLKGNDPSEWKTGIPTSTAVLYQNIYQNIDLKVYGMEKQVEYDWLINPGADPTKIRLQFHHVTSTALDKQGNLIVKTALGEFIHHHPVAFQSENGKKTTVTVEYVKVAKNEYRFQVGQYNKTCPLVIDPVVAVFSTYLGGGANDQSTSVALDIQGNAYITGITASSNFPTEDAYQNIFAAGTHDAYVSKFSASGNDLIFSTYLGGSGDDEAESIKVSTIGKIYITGSTTSPNFPVLSPFQGSHAGGISDVFLTILSEAGNSLVYSTYLGGNGIDYSFGLALDSNRNIYVIGATKSTNFPLQNPYKSVYSGGDYDAFVTKFNASGGSLEYSTYLGGSGTDIGYDITVLNSNAYIVGRTSSTNFSILNAYQPVYGGGIYDAFVGKLSSTGSLIYSTYLGGTLTESGYGIAVDINGKAYVVGETTSTDFPTLNGYKNWHYSSDKDAFLTKFSPTGVNVEYSTYLGGTEDDAAAHVLATDSGKVFLTGTTSSADFPLKRAYQTSFNGGMEAFVTMLSGNLLDLSFSTYIGGGDNDYGRSIVRDSSGNIYVTGETKSTDFPLSHPYQNTNKGGLDAYLIKLLTSQLGTLCGAVDNCNLTWTTGGSANWFEETDTYYYDNDAAQSGAVAYGQSSYIQTKVTGPGQFSFWWKITSQNTSNLTFIMDNQVQHTINGSTAWNHIITTIPEGTHTLQWVYYRGHEYYDNYNFSYLDKVEYSSASPLLLNRDHLTFGAILGTIPSAQTFAISNPSLDPISWTLTSNKSWLTCSTYSGTNDKVVTVNVNTTGLAVGTYTGTITIASSGTLGAFKTVEVTLNVLQPGGSAVPFGTYDTPTNNASIASSVPFTGWVLDDIGLQSVKLYRLDSGNLIYIGDATFVEGARPDVEAAYPNYPFNYSAGWGYMMLTNFLPNGGNGTYEIVAIATDIEGQQVTLGSKTLYIDNAHAIKPFGAIDTPAPGGTASGSSFVNFGWVLTPQPNSIPTNGSTIDVWIDGIKLGHPVYNQYRLDIATVFPGYANSNGAVGYYYFNTSLYKNGLHTIQWTATDNAGNTDGIGSRYFMIQNGSARSAQETSFTMGRNGERPSSKELTPNTLAPVQIQKGYASQTESGAFQTVFPDRQGVIRISIKELERVEFRFGKGGLLSGGLVKGSQMTSLPIGSTLDNINGTFCWQTGPGYLGEYRLVFARKNSLGKWLAQTILVTITPKF